MFYDEDFLNLYQSLRIPVFPEFYIDNNLTKSKQEREYLMMEQNVGAVQSNIDGFHMCVSWEH